MSALPALREAQQLYRLRTLRVQRARERIAPAQCEVDTATAAVAAGQRAIEDCRRQLDSLVHALVHTLAPRLPRWATTASAHRDRLADRLERAEYALVGDQRELEQAQENLQRKRAELTRELAREDAVDGLVEETRHARAQWREQRAERELEDQPLRMA